MLDKECKIIPLLAIEGEHTYTQAYRCCRQKQFQENRHAPATGRDTPIFSNFKQMNKPAKAIAHACMHKKLNKSFQ